MSANCLRTLYAYNNQGQVDRVQNPAVTITHSVYDGLSRLVSTWIGTDDSTTDGYKWTPANGSASSRPRPARLALSTGKEGHDDSTNALE